MIDGNCLAALVLAVATAMVPATAWAHEGHDPGVADAAQSGPTTQTSTFGESIPDHVATPLARALVGAASSDKRVIGGRIGKVCQKKGCWMTLLDGDVMVRVETGHRFAIPADAKGEAQVFGTLKKAELGEDRAAHLRSESLDVQAGEVWVIEAAGVRVLE